MFKNLILYRIQPGWQPDAARLEQALAAVRQAGLLAENVEVRHADLEDVFLNVMAAR